MLDIQKNMFIYIFLGCIRYMTNYNFGPWNSILEGKFDDYPISILLNEDGYMITQIKNPKNDMLLLSVQGIIKINGDAETFIETLPKKGIYVMIHDNKSTGKYMFLSKNSGLFKEGSEEAIKFVSETISDIEKDIKITKDIGSSYELSFTQYKELAKEQKKEIFVNPSIFTSLFSNISFNPNVNMPCDTSTTPMQKETSINIGFLKNTKDIASTNLDTFLESNYIIVKDDKIKRTITQILSEEFALKGINNIVFSFDKEIENLKYPNSQDIVREKLGVDPSGFPIAVLNSSTDVQVNLSELPFESLRDLYNLGDSKSANLIIEINKSKQPKTFDELIKEIDNYKPENTYSSYDINLARRIAFIINEFHKGLYTNNFDLSVLTKSANQKLGRTTIINLDADQTRNKIVIHSVLKRLSKINDNVSVYIPEVKDIAPKENLDLLQKEIVDILSTQHNKYIFVFSSSPLDINDLCINSSNAIIEVIESNDIAVKIRGSRPYRIELRPTISKS